MVKLETVKHISYDSNGHILKMYIKFDDPQAGLKKIDTDHFGKQHKWVPIEKAESNIMIRANKDGSPVIKKNSVSFDVSLGMYCSQGTRFKFG